MHIDLPVCKRCCCCLPLRYGLIAWGYLKAITAIILMLALFFDWSQMYQYPAENEYRITTSFLMFTITATALTIVDFILSLIFIVGCHQKNVQKIKTFYFYSQVLVALSTVTAIYDFIWITNEFLEYNDDMLLRIFRVQIINNSIIYVIDVGLQIYVLLLVRSEIIKLKDGGQFNFVNNAAEAECTLDMVESIGEKGTIK